jgi:cyclohexanecarboxylate-CoA ligase
VGFSLPPPPNADFYRSSGLWPGLILADYVSRAAVADPERIAVVDGRRRLTYGELDRESSWLADGLAASGVRAGDVVAVQLPNWHEFVVIAVATQKLGAVISPLTPILRPHELRTMLALAGATVAFFPRDYRGRDYECDFARLARDVSSLRHLIVVGDEPSVPGMLRWSTVLARGVEVSRRQPGRADPDDVCLLSLSSGTTGQPKGILHSANTLASSAEASVRVQAITSSDVMHITAAFGHHTAYIWGVWMVMAAGARLVLQDRWSTSEFFTLAEREAITISKGTTTHLKDIVAACGPEQRRALSGLRIYFCGGSPIPAAVARTVAQWSMFRLVPCWGMSENGPVTATFPGDPPDQVWSSDGRAYPGMRVEVRDPAGKPVEGLEGDLFAQGSFNLLGYSQGLAFTRTYLDEDGWLDTGDRAVMTAGFIRITGRRKDLVVRGGENIPVVEIENLLSDAALIRDVAVVGIPDDRLGEIACAVVVPASARTVSLDDIVSVLEDLGVTRQYIPERVINVTEIPKTNTGKHRKGELRELATRVFAHGHEEVAGFTILSYGAREVQ